MRLHLVGLAVLTFFIGHVFWRPHNAPASEPASESSLKSNPAGLDAKDSQKQFKTHPGVRVSLAAEEPNVIDPVSVRFDHRGRMWVVEMHDYPSGPADGEKPSGRIRILSDADRDGYFEQAKTFVDGLLFPTGLQPWKDGAIVTLAGKIMYFSDTDGDDVADRAETWFEGFAEENEQLRANHPTLGPDGLVYVAGGLRGGSIVSSDSRWKGGDEPLKLSSHDFAFDPHGGYWGAVTGNSQFGLTIDDFGRRIGCSNRNPAIEAIFTAELIARDRLLIPSQAYRDAALVGPESVVQPIAKAWTTSNLHAGQFSAACGVLFGGGTAMPQEWADDLFICEPTGYLVQRQETFRQDGHLVARRAPLDEECLASADPYFRPVDLAVGPDGALYVVDMYRAVIEHPDWAPSELKERSDERYGETRGRIWRLTSEQADMSSPVSIDRDDIDAVVEWLAHPNRWQRATGSRLLYERLGDNAAIDSVVQAVHDLLDHTDRQQATNASNVGSPEARARIAYLLAASNRMTAADRQRLLSDPDPSVRAVGVSLSQSFADADQLILERATDENSSVQLQAAVVIGSPSFTARARDIAPLVDGLVKMAATHPEADTFDIALGAVDAALLRPFLERLLAEPPATEVSSNLIEHLATRLGWEAPEAIDPVLAEIADSGSLRRVVLGIFQGARRRGETPAALTKKLGTQAAENVDTAFAEAWVIAANRTASTSDRLQAIKLLAFGDVESGESLQELVGFNQPPAVRVAILPLVYERDRERFLTWFDREGASLPPNLRSEAINQLLRSSATSLWLLEQVADGKIPVSTIGLNHSERLLRSSDAEVKSQAKQIFAEAGADRQAMVEQYQPALSGSADPSAGRALFREHCAACHRVDGIGTDVGADISDSRTKTEAALLTAILHPNAAIDAAFLRYTVLTVDGKVLDGLLVNETADEITLKVQGGELVVTPRTEIESFQTAGVSLMPEGFEQVITVDQMRDLLSFLKNWRYLDGSVPVETLRRP